ncbi:MAG: ATPase involved in repair [Pedosphaera sp.]|nr:ATPase involved in repair [Pedosphaera sp.]
MRQIGGVSGLSNSTAATPEFKKWKRDAEVAIAKIFGGSGRHLKDFAAISFTSGRSYLGKPTTASLSSCQKGLAGARQILQSMLEEIEKFGLSESPVASSTPSLSHSKADQRELMISHSSADKLLAEALVDLLGEALMLARSSILCTSVDGTKLEGGAETDDVLRQAIRKVPAFISILTPKSITSTYVLFELGARWSSDNHHIPLLAKGAGSEVIKAPLRKNALKLSVDAEVFQLLNDLAGILKRQVQAPNGYLGKIKKVVELASQIETTVAASNSSAEIAKNLVRQGNVYYQTIDGIKKGPFCMTCWDADEKLINVILRGHGLMRCVRCNKK